MPLKIPYTTVYSARDVFYGLATPRAALMDILAPNRDRAFSDTTIDDFFLNLAYFDQGEAYPQDFEVAVRALVKTLQGNAKFMDAFSRDDSSNETIRRKCKGGIQWATNEGRNVHFCLDEITMLTVVEKNHHDVDKNAIDEPAGKAGPNGPKNRVYTNAELRWVYRNRHQANVATRVQFWLANVACAPPWDPSHVWPVGENRTMRGDEVWRRYKPTSVVEPQDAELIDTAPPLRVRKLNILKGLKASGAKVPPGWKVEAVAEYLAVNNAGLRYRGKQDL